MQSNSVSQIPPNHKITFARGIVPEAAKRMRLSRSAIYKRIARADVTTLEMLGKVKAEFRRADKSEERRRQRALLKLKGAGQ